MIIKNTVLIKRNTIKTPFFTLGLLLIFCFPVLSAADSVCGDSVCSENVIEVIVPTDDFVYYDFEQASYQAILYALGEYRGGISINETAYPFVWGEQFIDRNIGYYVKSVDSYLDGYWRGSVTFEVGENSNTCPTDCHLTTTTILQVETNCTDGIDNDVDGNIDCLDYDCSSNPDSGCCPINDFCRMGWPEYCVCCGGTCHENGYICGSATTTSTTSTSSSTTTTTSTSTTTKPTTTSITSAIQNSGGGGGGTSEKRIAEFQDFPKKVSVEQGQEKKIKGQFFTNMTYIIYNITFSMSGDGFDRNWAEINPDDVESINSGEAADISITFNIPETAKTGGYNLELIGLSLKSGVKKEYSTEITLSVIQSRETTTTQTTSSTTTITVPEPGQSQGSPLTGFFVEFFNSIKAFWGRVLSLFSNLHL